MAKNSASVTELLRVPVDGAPPAGYAFYSIETIQYWAGVSLSNRDYGGTQLFSRKFRRPGFSVAAAIAASALVLAGCSSETGSVTAGETSSGSSGDEPVSLTMLIDNGEAEVVRITALVDAYKEVAPNVTISIETRPGGSEGDNITKTRLATGEMSDIFLYNSGSLFQALNPVETLEPLTNEPFMSEILDSFLAAVSIDGDAYGVPIGTAMGGGILYNIRVYEELGLSIPLTWDEFMENNRVVKEAGLDPVIQTYGDDWSAQLLVLADFHNVAVLEPDFAERYTVNQATFADSPAAQRGFNYLAELNELGYYNRDFATATFNDGLLQLAEGSGAHYPMLSFAIASLIELAPESADDIGFFAQPGDDASTNGLTVWTSNSLYIPKTSDNIDAAKDFLAFVNTPEGCEIQSEAVGQQGPYFVKGCGIGEGLSRAIADMLPYFEREGGTTPALEFLSPVKGPRLPQITVAVGTGQFTGAEGAATYDDDVVAQSQQLGLPGW